MKTSKKNRERDGYREAMRQVYHAVLARILKSVKEVAAAGGFKAKRVSYIQIFNNNCINIFHISSDKTHMNTSTRTLLSW